MKLIKPWGVKQGFTVIAIYSDRWGEILMKQPCEYMLIYWLSNFILYKCSQLVEQSTIWVIPGVCIDENMFCVMLIKQNQLGHSIVQPPSPVGHYSNELDINYATLLSKKRVRVKVVIAKCHQHQLSYSFVALCPHLALEVLNFWKFTSYCSSKPLWSGMGEVVPARTSLTLHPPSPPTVHQLWLAL